MSENKHYYTDEKNAQIVIALLKAHGIRKVIANPGTTNIAIVGSVQNDPWFQVYSGIDERHSAYMAVGMATESGEPVVLSCTGATASRNYLPALTEAYYRKLPVLALTSMHHFNGAGNLVPQMLDRTVQPKDAIRFSLQCPVPVTQRQIEDCVSNVNKALLELTRDGGGPVHINLETERGFSFGTTQLPDCRIIRRICQHDSNYPEILAGAKIAVWIGAHKPFSAEESNALNRFAAAFDAVVVTDITSSSYRGGNAVNPSLLCSQRGVAGNPKYCDLVPDLVIHIGEICGDYPTAGVLRRAREFWRVGEDGEARDLFNRLTYVFQMDEAVFFNHYSDSNAGNAPRKGDYAIKWRDAVADLRLRMPELPFSNIWMASRLHGRLPQGARLHLGILNSLRSWNLFDFPDGVTASCNVGGFGIDGSVSTMIGASLASPDRLFFGVFGDLGFFYDLNALGNRHIGKNLRILLVNNGCGAEFMLYSHPASRFGESARDFMAAGRHFRDRSSALVRHYAEDLGFKYLSADSKESFQEGMAVFLAPDSSTSVLFECYTEYRDESDALAAMSGIDAYDAEPGGRTFSDAVKSVVPQRVRNAVKELIR